MSKYEVVSLEEYVRRMKALRENYQIPPHLWEQLKRNAKEGNDDE